MRRIYKYDKTADKVVDVTDEMADRAHKEYAGDWTATMKRIARAKHARKHPPRRK